ncbi:PREDICTED: nodal modulator 3 [Tarenaya hassleriana]|uniref:nodal modulator 3 n=1 Tax=Tarenaya hassleriana TaxID=28532 RepID=UPI00053CA2CB|nr:PREDICTED: nodal modulator 3 [Tarenaya hassleriana]
MALPTAFRGSLIFFFIAISTVYGVSADSIKGCGGFVEASSSLSSSRKAGDGKLDYSHITVELRTVDGLVKDQTQCAPNGYYFIPVYDKGSFILRINGPEGWSWNPDKVPVVVDDSGCNNNEDINFRFTGFTLSGKVLGGVGGESCVIKNGGPSGVNVELFSPNDDPIASVVTSSDGNYLFKNIIPGKYKIRASHPDLKVEVRGSTEVELGFANGMVDDIFFVLGYDLKGSVVAQGNPILGVNVYLYSDDVAEVDCPQGFGDASGEKKALCRAVSDADGTFSFKSIPCGKYELVPYYKGENTVFDISPSVLHVSVEHQHVTTPQKFQVTGFSIGGRVVDGYGMGVEGVKILVDGNQRSVTDKEGYYTLDQVTSNHYTIEAIKEHYKFDKLKKFLVLPNMASLPDISAVSYDICGLVRMFRSGYKAKVALTHGPTDVKPQMKQTSESGTFCFQVPPGEYRLSALSATPKTSSELLFVPAYVDVAVKSPLCFLSFCPFFCKLIQARVNIHGSVTCKEKCGLSVSVTLVGVAGNRDKKTVALTDESNEFHVSDVLPGKYRLEVKNIMPEAASKEDSWCWERSSIDVDVGTKDVEGIEFVQKGYWINVISTNDVDASMIQPNGSPTDLKIKKGSQKICVESPGEYELHFSNSCISFGSDSVKIDVSKPQPVHLKAEKYLLKGVINVEFSSTHIESELPESFVVDIQDKEGNVVESIAAKLASDEHGVYEYNLWAHLGEKINFIPRDSRSDVEKKILFYPKQHHAVVSNDGCQASVSPFTGRLGLYIQGSVSPPLSGVHIKVLAAKDSHISLLKKGELAVETSTSADGSFVAGPLYDDITYDAEASKPGYHIKRLGPYSFSCQKLGQISVRVYIKDDEENPIPSVLLSLSGDDGYRNNSVSGVGGQFIFDSLFPGNFYLRPLLKEYAFSPSTLAIELGSGESREAVFEATRIAYSAMGRVALVSGQPKGVSIEARSESKGYYEETTSDSNGNYRLRGLHPDTTYVIKVARKNGSGNNGIERASPDSVSIKVGYEDMKGLDFLVFEQPETTILTCHVEGQRSDELNSDLLVEIKSASGDGSNIENVFPLPLSNFFQVKGLSRGKHLLQLKSSIRPSSLKLESEIIEVDLETNSQIHIGPLRYTLTADHQSQDVTAAPILPLVVGVSAIALFLSIPRLKDVYLAVVGTPSSGFVSSAKKEPRKPVARKKAF